MSDNVTVTVPPVPDELHPAACWRRTLTSLNPEERGGRVVCGEWLRAGDSVAVPAGTLVVAVDKATLGWDVHYKTGRRYAVEDATVTVLLAQKDGLTVAWTRHFKQAKSAFGATTMRKLEQLLQQHPAPEGTVTVLHEARRPNSKDGRCRWCRYTVDAGRGHLVGHGAGAEVEHYKDCPPAGQVTTGEVCARCGVTVKEYQARRYHKRDGSGETEVRHTPVDGRTCLERPVPSAEEQAAADAERRRAEQAAFVEWKQEIAAEKARADAKKAKKDARHAAEQARVAGLKTIKRASKTLANKNLGNGLRARLVEHTDTLEDTTTTTRWTVETYGVDTGWTGEDYDPDPGTGKEYTRKEDARAAYRELKYQRTPRSSRGDRRSCDNCDRDGAYNERYDASNIAGFVCNRCDGYESYMLSFA